MIDDYLQSARIACFSMEVALRGDITAYAHDPGILAGFTVRWTDQCAWGMVRRGTITKNAALFNSHRMMRRYTTDAYLG